MGILLTKVASIVLTHNLIGKLNGNMKAFPHQIIIS